MDAGQTTLLFLLGNLRQVYLSLCRWGHPVTIGWPHRPGFERQQAEHQPIKHRVMLRHAFAGIDTLEEALHPALRQFNAQPASAMLTASAQSFDLIRTTAA